MLSNYISAFIFIIIGIQIIFTKDLSLKGTYAYFDNWAYLIGGVFLILGIYILFNHNKGKGSDPK